MTIIKLPSSIAKFVSAHEHVVSEWSKTGLKFTLDGRLVGDIAEAVAAEEFGLDFPKKRTPGVDLLTRDPYPKSVQVKASGIGKGPAFTPGKGTADFLIFMLIDFRKCEAEIVYNGPEKPVREKLPPDFSGTKRVKLSDVVKLNTEQKNRLLRHQKDK
jgi:hypothetical protein